jgi:hypothetical protein
MQLVDFAPGNASWQVPQPAPQLVPTGAEAPLHIPFAQVPGETLQLASAWGTSQLPPLTGVPWHVPFGMHMPLIMHGSRVSHDSPPAGSAKQNTATAVIMPVSSNRISLPYSSLMF